MAHKIKKRETEWKQIGESCLRGQKQNGIKLFSNFKQLMYVSCLGFLSTPRMTLLHCMSKQALSPSRGIVTVKSVSNVYRSIEEGCISMWWLSIRLWNQHTLKNMSEYLNLFSYSKFIYVNESQKFSWGFWVFQSLWYETGQSWLQNIPNND